MLANLENSAAATGLEKVNFSSNSKKEQCQRMFKLPHNYTHFTCWQGNAPNPSSKASIVCEPRASRCTVEFRKGRGTRDHIANFHWIIEKNKIIQEQTSTSASLTMLKLLTVWITTYYGKFSRDGNT